MIIDKDTPFRTTIGFVLFLVTLTFSLAASHFSLSSKVDMFVRQHEEDKRQIEMMWQSLRQMQGDVNSVSENVKWFRQTYERDMNRYIRENPKESR